MIISEETRSYLNKLLGLFFGNNSEADNLAYCIDDACYPRISEVYHERFAHFFTGPVMADGISGLMSQLDARAERLAVPEHTHNYEGDLVKIFEDNEDMCKRCREAIIAVIECAEDNDDYEVKIYGEELLMKFMPYYKQARVWAEFARRYKDDEKSFEERFNNITTFIS